MSDISAIRHHCYSCGEPIFGSSWNWIDGHPYHLICSESPTSQVTELTARVAVLQAALNRSVIALDDWLRLDFPDHFETWRVEESRARVYANGSVAYIADVQQQNRAALVVKS